MPYRRAFTWTELVVTLAIIAGLIALLLPAVRYARETNGRFPPENFLKQIALAAHAYYEVYESFPPAYMTDPDGNPLYSWRVLLLPFLERKELYDKFHLDEPWNSPYNATLLKSGPYMYDSNGNYSFMEERCVDGIEFANFVMVVGPNTISDGPNGVKIDAVTDGTSNTILFIETRKEIPWTAPVDLPLEALNLGVTKHGGPDESVGADRPAKPLPCWSTAAFIGSIRRRRPNNSNHWP